ncbi:hypothetical protein [Paraglaciecola chathamensis]|jgi:hypothetical protein|uniref:Uncharacterized protein n=1 Tax=Paraglaciecola chathamensis TaxID=368405 RepID=A0A8H9IIR6_9ALTE|nr:hypothetical protein [Paraglaciecola oceanifecundans]GGZ77682.1 hypothetical protein GCM10011274_39710 [Paraglaciecola oceanifecundans]|tara:strand:- start:13594 stop:13944 length:351 start_codon:yes stop_codon:yes gene_type:complete
MSNTFQSLTLDLAALLNKQITPRSIIGTGYKNPRSVASAWLRKEMHNLTNPNCKISQVHVKADGHAFESELKAKRCKPYKALATGTYQTINNRAVLDYGVMPSPCGGGYLVYVVQS